MTPLEILVALVAGFVGGVVGSLIFATFAVWVKRQGDRNNRRDAAATEHGGNSE